MIKNIIVADRQTGKTTHLITKCSNDKYSLIVCPFAFANSSNFCFSLVLTCTEIRSVLPERLYR